MSAQTVQFRIKVLRPPPGVAFSLQRKKDELVDVVMSNGSDLVFEWDMTAERAEGDAVRLLGPFSQGPPSARFVYLCIGKSAGQWGSPWTRRVKVPLAGVTWPLVEEALKMAGSVIEAAYEGTAKDGSPACATVKLTTEWRLA
jgi:hypothetical protein